MTNRNVVNTVPNEEGVKGKSLQWAAAECGLALNTFSKGVAAGWILAQATIEGETKNAYGFSPEYVAEIKPIFRTNRVQGESVFTPEVITKLELINARWKKRSR